MARPYVGPRLIMGVILGVVLGFLAVSSLFLALAVILACLYLIGRRPSRHRVNTPFGPRMTPEVAHEVFTAQLDTEAEAERMKVWRSAQRGFLPGWTPQVHLDRPFRAYTDCEAGHRDIHPVGDTFTHDGHRRIVRRCADDTCPSTWTELA